MPCFWEAGIWLMQFCYNELEGFACYDEKENMSTIDYQADSKVGIFLGYTDGSDWEVCEVYIGSQEKKIIMINMIQTKCLTNKK